MNDHAIQDLESNTLTDVLLLQGPHKMRELGYDWEQVSIEICDWLRRHGIAPLLVPQDATISRDVVLRRVYCTHYRVDEQLRVIPDASGREAIIDVVTHQLESPPSPFPTYLTSRVTEKVDPVTVLPNFSTERPTLYVTFNGAEATGWRVPADQIPPQRQPLWRTHEAQQGHRAPDGDPEPAAGEQPGELHP